MRYLLQNLAITHSLWIYPFLSVYWPKYGLLIDAKKGSYIVHVGIIIVKQSYFMPISSMTDFDFYLLPYPIFTGRRNILATMLYNIILIKEGEGATYLSSSMSCILLWIYFLLLELKSSFISVFGEMPCDSWASSYRHWHVICLPCFNDVALMVLTRFA